MKIKTEKSYKGVRAAQGVFLPCPAVAGTTDKMPPGMYTLGRTGDGQLYFQPVSLTSDDVLDLPSAAYQQVMKELDIFLKPETHTAFKDLGYVYKRSALLHGVPGTGKSCIANRIAKKVVEAGHIVLFSPSPELLTDAFLALDDLQPEQNTLVIFEEIDALIESGYESKLLVLLDGQVQKDRVVYLATTNYLEKIPKRIYRPGRMSSVIEVGFPEADARKAYLQYKLGEDHKDIAMLTEATSGFSIDEVKEVVQSVFLLGNTLESTTARIQAIKGIPDIAGQDDEEEYDNPFEAMAAKVLKQQSETILFQNALKPAAVGWKVSSN